MHRTKKITNDPTAKVGISENAAACRANITKNTERPPILSERAGHRRRPTASEAEMIMMKAAARVVEAPHRASHHPGLGEDGETRCRVEEEHCPEGVQPPRLEGVAQAPRAPTLILTCRLWRTSREAHFTGRVPHEPGGAADDGGVDDSQNVEGLERPASR